MAVLEVAERPYSYFEEAVYGQFDDVFPEPVRRSFEDYVVITLIAFGHVDSKSMGAEYLRQCAHFAMLAGEYYFDSVIGQIQKGDTNLFHTMFFESGPYLTDVVEHAETSYGNVAALLRGNHDSHAFFSSMAAGMHMMPPAMWEVRRRLNIEPAKMLIRTSTMEGYFQEP